MAINIDDWYEFTLAQMASDSYLDGINLQPESMADKEALKDRLQNGANHYETVDRNIRDNNLSATRMVILPFLAGAISRS
jgi:hypothetical protein